MVRQTCFLEWSLTHRGLPYFFLYLCSLSGIIYLITYFVPLLCPYQYDQWTVGFSEIKELLEFGCEGALARKIGGGGQSWVLEIGIKDYGYWQWQTLGFNQGSKWLIQAGEQDLRGKKAKKWETRKNNVDIEIKDYDRSSIRMTVTPWMKMRVRENRGSLATRIE